MTTLHATVVHREKYGAGYPQPYEYRAPLHVTVTHRDRGLAVLIQGSEKDTEEARTWLQKVLHEGAGRVVFTKHLLERGSLNLIDRGQTTPRRIAQYTLSSDRISDIQYAVAQPKRSLPRFWSRPRS